MKKNVIIVFILLCGFSFGQEKSSASKFISDSKFVQVSLDGTEKAIFKSGWGETVSFYPAKITNLKNNEIIYGLSVESMYVLENKGMMAGGNTVAYETAYIGIEELTDLITYFETFVIPSLNTDVGKKKVEKYIFESKEITIIFSISGDDPRFSVKINDSAFRDKYFWTEARVKDIPNVLTTLKYLKEKASK